MPSPAAALRFLSFVLLAAALAWLAWARPQDLLAVPDHLARLPLRAWLAVVALALWSYGLRFLRWHLLLRRLGHHVPLGRQALIYLSGFGLAMTPAKLGETVRSAYLLPLGVPLGHSLAALFVERIADVFAVALLAGLLATRFDAAPLWLSGVGAGLLAALVVSRANGLASLAARLGQGALGRTAGDGADALHRLLGPASLAPALLLGALAWTGQGVGLWYVLAADGPAPPLPSAVGSYALSLLAGALSLLPGGLGATEGALVLLLQQQGTEFGRAASAALLGRGVPLGLGMLAGLLALGTLGWRHRH
jgi:uncharacterized membrane protein YbhN (UPF0104 family)